MASEGKCFTILWKVKNMRYCPQKTGERIISPAFVVDTLDGTKWKLWLYPRGNRDKKDVSCFLYREADSKGAEKIEIKFELALIAEDGSATKLGEGKNVFAKGGDGIGWRNMPNRKDVFEAKCSAFLPEDTLTVRCRLWKSVGEMAEEFMCIAHTCVGVEKRSFLWNVENFSKLKSGNKFTYVIKSVKNEASVMSVDLSLTGELGSEEIRFELSLQEKTIKFSSLRLSLVDASGNREDCRKEDIWFDDPVSRKQLTCCFTRKKLLEKSMYLPNDTLTLLWEWVFSKGVVSEEIEEVLCGCEKIQMADRLKIIEEKNSLSTHVTALISNMKSLYDEQFLSDVKLKTNTSEFPAHKFVLSASSAVFKAMFSNDMKERNSYGINIEDLSDDTIGRMLQFVYTASVEDLTWDSASHLYEAADKYAILSLKNICSSFLKDNLSPQNACEALLLSDLHCDDDLKTVVQEYILKNAKQITKSDEWEDLLKANARLAAETLCLLFK